MILRYSAIVVMVLVWLSISWLGLIQPGYLPHFTDVATKIGSFFTEKELEHLWLTFYRTMAGFFLSGLLAIPIGILIGLNKKTYQSLEVVIDFFRSIPATAMFPLFLLFLGIGDASKIAIAVFISFWIVLLNTIHAVWNVPKQRIQVGQIFKSSKLQMIKNIIVPNALPQIFVGLKISMSLSLIVIVVTEMFIGTKYGLGQLIYESYISFDITGLYAYIIIVGLLGYFLNKIIFIIDEKVIHWADK
jgi:ABC-type nitrate/sulfonate/bicarbonate transport system permease component